MLAEVSEGRVYGFQAIKRRVFLGERAADEPLRTRVLAEAVRFNALAASAQPHPATRSGRPSKGNASSKPWNKEVKRQGAP
jgi:hypothetical protein